MRKIELNQQLLLNAPVPVLPIELDRIMEAFQNENITHRKLAEIISGFPSIAARLIFLANSAWAAPRVPVENLLMACTRLGFSMVRSVSISLCIASPFNALKRCPSFNTEFFWCSTLLTADSAVQLLACLTDAKHLDPSTLHTAGLLHNLGLLWLASNWPEHTSAALDNATGDDSVTTVQALRTIMGTDYCEAGGVLGRAWKLPDVLISAMEQNCRDLYQNSQFQSTKVVGYASEMVSALQAGSKQRPSLPHSLNSLFDPVCLDNVYGGLDEKLDKTQELARTMFACP